MKSKKYSFNVWMARIIVVLIFLLCFCISSVVCLISNKNTLKVNAQDNSVDLILNNFQSLSKLEKDYRNENPDVSANEVVAYLENCIKELERNEVSLLTDSSIGDSSYSIFGKTVTSAEIKLVAAYPAQAIIAFNASEDAVAKIEEFYDLSEPAWLNNADAFRHAYWNALMERRISKEYHINTGTADMPIYLTVTIDFAKEFADAHEYGSSGIDCEMDLKNNAMGRSDGATYLNLNDHQLASKIVERISFGHYWKIINYQVENGIVSGDLVQSDWIGLLPEIYDAIMFEVSFINSNEVILNKLNLDINGTYTVPTLISGKIVVEIGPYAFQTQEGLSNIILPESITTLADNAFNGCLRLCSISGMNNVQKIGNEAFLGCRDLNSISSLEKLTYIGYNAFKNCTSLSEITIPNSVSYIGQATFAGCNNLNLTVSADNPNYSAEGNILYNKDKTTLISACNVASVINIPTTVTSISPYAFDGNSKLTELHIEHTPNIGQLAFANCENLTSVYFYSYTIPAMDSGAFLNDDFTLYVPHSLQGTYQTAFVGYTNKIASIPIKVSFMLDDAEWNTLDTYFGANIDSSIPIPFKEGYTFNFWIDAAGNTYQHGDVWDSTVDLTVEADWTARQAYINFVGYGTSGIEPILVTYDMPIGTLPTPNVNGPTFLGWKDENGTMYTSDTVWKRTNSLTLMADYVGEEVGDTILYYVDLDQDGGEGGSDNLRAEYLAPMPTATVPTRVGYTFNGYYTGKNGTGTKYYNANMSSAKDWDIASDKTLYAYWVGKKYSLTLDLQGGYGGTTSVVATYGSPMPTDNVTAPTRTGYTFKGYYDQKNGNGTKYYEGPNISSVNEWDKTFNATLYAYWEKNFYDITIDWNYNYPDDVISVGYEDVVSFKGVYYVPNRVGYRFNGIWAEPGGQGVQYFGYEIILGLTEDRDMYSVIGKDRIWGKTSGGIIYAHWIKIEIDYEYEIIISNKKDESKYYSVHMVQGETLQLIAPTISGYTFEKICVLDEIHETNLLTLPNIQLLWNMGFGKRDVDITREYYFVGYNGVRSRYSGLFMVYKKNECVAEGTMITLADGTQRAVEKLTGNERLLVWNLHTGKFDSAPILFIDKDALSSYQVINLAFSDETSIKVISEHGFWDYNLNRYVYLDKNAAQYIGHWFNKQTTEENGNMISVRVKLTGVTITTEQTVAYSPVTYGHLCYYVNGMLSMPGGIDGLFNIFEVDAESMKYNTVAMERDIEQYGLFTYEEFAQILPVPQEVFNAFNAQYFKVAIGKGIVTEERLEQLVNRYAEQLGIG